jgi:hypothetical protein
MTQEAPARPDTALSLLFGPGAPGTDDLPRQLEDQLGGVLDNLPHAIHDAAAGQIAAAAAQLLDVNLADVLIGAWRLHEELVKAARRSLQAPGGITLQDLLPFQVSVTQDPYIDILVDDRPVARVQFSLTLEYEVRAMLPEIRAGRLVALHDGHCDVTATLAIENQQIASRSVRFELPGAIRLGAGLRLLPAEEYAVTARAAAPRAAR